MHRKSQPVRSFNCCLSSLTWSAVSCVSEMLSTNTSYFPQNYKRLWISEIETPLAGSYVYCTVVPPGFTISLSLCSIVFRGHIRRKVNHTHWIAYGMYLAAMVNLWLSTLAGSKFLASQDVEDVDACCEGSYISLGKDMISRSLALRRIKIARKCTKFDENSLSFFLQPFIFVTGVWVKSYGKVWKRVVGWW